MKSRSKSRARSRSKSVKRTKVMKRMKSKKRRGRKRKLRILSKPSLKATSLAKAADRPVITGRVTGRIDFGRRRRKKAKRIGFALYIFRILKSVDSGVGISRNAMFCMNSLTIDLYNRIAVEAGNLVSAHGVRTMRPIDARTATSLVIRGALGQQAKVEGHKALTKFHATRMKEHGHRVRRGSRRSSRASTPRP